MKKILKYKKILIHIKNVNKNMIQRLGIFIDRWIKIQRSTIFPPKNFQNKGAGAGFTGRTGRIDRSDRSGLTRVGTRTGFNGFCLEKRGETRPGTRARQPGGF